MLEIFDNTCILLAKAEQKHYNYTKEALQKAGFEFGPIHMLLMYTLFKGDGINLTDLGKRCFLENSTLTGLIDKLEALGLVERRSVLGDRRAYNIFLTDKAKEIQGEMSEVSRYIYEKMVPNCSAEDIAAFRRVLLNIYENL